MFNKIKSVKLNLLNYYHLISYYFHKLIINYSKNILMRSDILFQSSPNHIIVPPHPNPCGSQCKAVLRHRCQYYFYVIHQL